MSEIYRDRTEGTAAKRQELLRRRRDELVTMPHAVRRVVVARSARIAASLAITLGGVALIVTASSPGLASRIASWMPGIQPAPLSTLLSGTWLVGLVAWAVSRARVEHRFAVAMSRYVLPTDDLDHDVERLDHEHPDDIARTMGQQLEVRSAAWPILAASLIVPVTALWVARAVRTGAWPVMSEFEVGVAAHATVLALIGAAGAVVAVAMTRKAARQPAVAMIALPTGIIAAGLACVGVARGTALSWLACGFAVIVLGMGLVARRLRRERALLEIDDPAAGSELFTIRGMIREVRGALVAVRNQLRGVSRRTWVKLGGVAAVATGLAVALWPHHQPARNANSADTAQLWRPAAVRAAQTQLLPSPPLDNATVPYKVDRVGNRFRVEAVLDAHGELVVPMVGFATVPENWSATLAIDLAGDGPLGVVSGDHVTYLSAASPRTILQIDGCTGPRALEVHVVQSHLANQQVTFFVQPTLSVARCDR